MRLQTYSLSIAGVLAACFLSLPAHANKGGITGYSGKSAGVTCMSAGCHGDSPSSSTPTVEISGPSSLAAGATGNYTLIIRGGPAVVGGMNVAVSDATAILNAAGSDLKVLAKELTHTAPKPFTSGEVRFDFSMVAPASARTIKLYASGNSTNNSDSPAGDHSASTTLDVQITGGGSGGPDGGTPDGGTTNPGNGDGDGGNEDDGGCSAAGGAPMVVLLALFAAARMRRRTS